MNNAMTHDRRFRMRRALTDGTSSLRLQAALALGTEPDDDAVAALVQRAGVEPDFFVRDMLTWALTRHSTEVTVPALVAELSSPSAQARSQALHTLSKIGSPAGWGDTAWLLLHDRDDEVARAAWRTSVVLVPAHDRLRLAAELAKELGRGGRDVRRSLARALIALGDAAMPVLLDARRSASAEVREHAAEIDRLMIDPDGDFAGAVDDAKRAASLKDAPMAEPPG